MVKLSGVFAFFHTTLSIYQRHCSILMTKCGRSTIEFIKTHIFSIIFQLCRFLLVKTSPCRICSCIGDVIDCDKRGLTGFHVTAAFNSTKWKQLLLAHNKLTHVPDLSRFTQLRKLDLSHNRITGIPADAFSSLASLTELDLSMNMNFQLSDTGLPSAAFSGLKSLEILR